MTALAVPLVLKDAEEKMRKALELLGKEFATIHGGRASLALLEPVKVECYGSTTPLKQLASLSTPDPRLIVIQPWDPNLLRAIERAILTAGLGVTPTIDKKVVRVPIPPLSSERREELVKVVHRQTEASRVAIRNIRHAAKEAIEKLFKDKAIAEDDKFKAIDDLDKLTHRTIGQADTLLKTKESDIRAV